MTPAQPPPLPAARPWLHPFPPPLILPPEQPERFRLGPVSIGVLLLCLIVHCLVGLPRWQRSPITASQDIGVFVFEFLVSIALAVLCWKIDAQRRAGGLVFCFLMLLFAAGRMIESANANLHTRIRQEQQARERSHVAANASRNAQAPRPATDSPAPVGHPAADRSARTVPPGVDPAQGTDRRLREAMANVMVGLKTKTEIFDAAGARLKEAGGCSAIGLDSPGAIARRRQLTKACIDANAVMTVASQTVEGDLLAALRRVAPEAEAQRATRHAMESFDAARTLRIRDCERRGFEAIDGELSLFQREFSRWHVDADKKLAFDNPAVIPWYKRWAQQLQDATQEEARVRQEMAARKSVSALSPSARQGGDDSAGPL